MASGWFRVSRKTKPWLKVWNFLTCTPLSSKERSLIFYNIYTLLNTRDRILISVKIIKIPTNIDALLRICFKEIIQHNKAQFGQFSLPVVSNSLRPHESQHTRLPCPSPTPGVHPNSWALSRWCHPAMSSSVVPFSSCPQSFPASGSFPMSQLFAWGGQSNGVSALASVLPVITQDWSPLEWTGWISLQSKGLSRVFSKTAVQKHQFFGAQPSQSNSHIHTWLLEKP